MKPAIVIGMATMGSLFVFSGCAEQDPDAAPEIRYGDNICTECGMIISDERFATSTIIESDRGHMPVLFDDFNCQMNYEAKHPELKIVTRWSHDHESKQWFSTEDLWFVRSDQLRTPMASHIAAFETHEQAKTFAESIDGQIFDFRSLWTEQ